jgi:multidrug efflux pump subunit AcrB
MAQEEHTIIRAIIDKFLRSNMPLIIMIASILFGAMALLKTPREEDPQIVVPLADVFVSFPGRSAKEVEQLVSVPLEKLLYQIDGVEHVYSMSRTDQAIVTVRFYVGEDRERSLIKLYNKIYQNVDLVPPGVTGWVVKPVEIDDVPIVTFTLTSKTETDYHLRRVAEELSSRLAGNPNISRIYLTGGRPRQVKVYLAPDRMAAYSVDPLMVQQALKAANVTMPAGDFDRNNRNVLVDAGQAFVSPEELKDLVVSVYADRPVFLKDIATIDDGPAEVVSYVRMGWGPAWNLPRESSSPGSIIGGETSDVDPTRSTPAVTLGIAKKKGTNAVDVARAVIAEMDELKSQVVPDDVSVIITRNAGLTANEKVNELIESLAVAVIFVIVTLAITLGFREAMVVCITVPIVFGLTLFVNMIAGYTINRVTLFALILSLGLLVDDPTVDVENIFRHFKLRRKASRRIVLEAVSEVRPPLISATFAVVVSFLPMMFISGMMGPYMRPMAMNVPVTMIVSMLLSFTVTPWLGYYFLKRKYPLEDESNLAALPPLEDPLDKASEHIKDSPLYKFFKPMMEPLLRRRRNSAIFLGVIGLLFVLSLVLAGERFVPLKMLPFDNKNELAVVLDFDEGTTLQQADACVRQFEEFIRRVPEVTDYQSYVGTASPMDFNGLVRHYYLRQGRNVADIRINFVPKKSRAQQSHAIALRLRPELEQLAKDCGATLSIVETPPGPPVIQTVVAEVMGKPSHTYADLMRAAKVVRNRLELEAGVADVDDTAETPQEKFVFVTDKEKARINGATTAQIAQMIEIALKGQLAGTVQLPNERKPLEIILRLTRPLRSSLEDLTQLYVTNPKNDNLVPLSELGRWETRSRDQTIYHKDMKPVVYIFADVVGRPPADAILDIQADRTTDPNEQLEAKAIPVAKRSFFSNGAGIPWHLPKDFWVRWSGEGEWQVTLEVFRDMGIAYVVALIGIYVIFVNQTGSFTMPLVVMMAIPLTFIGIMPGFWLLNKVAGGTIAGHTDPVFFTATAMIGMIALAGIVTRDAIVLVDFIHLSLARGRSLFDAIMESRVIRLRPILLTSVTTVLGASPITLDPIFSGLAWSLIFGMFASTTFTLFVIPIAYWLLYANKPGHGLPPNLLLLREQNLGRVEKNNVS